MALGAIVSSINEGCLQVVDVDLKSYFDTIDHELLMRLVKRRVGDTQILRLIRAWLKAGVMEEGKVTHPDRGSPQGGVISPLLSNIFLYDLDRRWCRSDGVATSAVRLVRYANDMVLLARTERQAQTAWDQLQREFAELRLVVNQEKSRLTTLAEGFAFLGFEFRKAAGGEAADSGSGGRCRRRKRWSPVELVSIRTTVACYGACYSARMCEERPRLATGV